MATGDASKTLLPARVDASSILEGEQTMYMCVWLDVCCLFTLIHGGVYVRIGSRPLARG